MPIEKNGNLLAYISAILAVGGKLFLYSFVILNPSLQMSFSVPTAVSRS